jgi:hypothetical protein
MRRLHFRSEQIPGTLRQLVRFPLSVSTMWMKIESASISYRASLKKLAMHYQPGPPERYGPSPK